MFNSDLVAFQLVLQVVDTITERLEVAHVEYLRTDMEVQSHELHMFHPDSLSDDIFHIPHGNAKLILCQTRRDVGMGMSAHVGVDAKGHTGGFTRSASQ